jgi:uncharacterized protein (DUF433 family)
MERNELLKRIAIDPDVCFGKPCIRGIGSGCLSSWIYSRLV